MGHVVLHFGGNGHAAVRLEAVRAALVRRAGSPVLIDVPYPGFEGRPRARSPEAFLDVVDAYCREQPERPDAAIASGIGALIALALRARGGLAMPLIFQGPVLWGLERRTFPKLMRWSSARFLLSQAWTLPVFRDLLVRRLFLGPLDPTVRRRFAEGYARCTAFADFFGWFTPEWLRALERRLAARPGALDAITVWIGGRDRVVGRDEVEWTEKALGTHWPIVEFSGWGHYPMIEVPEEWAEALRNALATP